MENLEELKSKYEGKQMISKIEDINGIKRLITIHSLVIINIDEKETINFNYSWQNQKSNEDPLGLNLISILELINNYELI